MIVCPRCQSTVSPGASDCARCGLAFGGDVQPIQAEAQAQAAEPVGTVPAQGTVKPPDWYLTYRLEGSGQEIRSGKEDFATELERHIRSGTVSADTKVTVHQLDKDGKPLGVEARLFDFARANAQLRRSFGPVRAAALTGLKWGVLCGIGVRFVDLAIGFAQLDPRLAFLFLVTVGVVFIPKVGLPAIVIVSIAARSSPRPTSFSSALRRLWRVHCWAAR
jgi:hypothetical protein